MNGSELYVFHLQDYLFFFGAFMLPWIIMRWFNKAPSVAEIRDFANVWNSRGGNLVILTLLTAYSMRVSMRFIYHLMAMIAAKQLDSSDGHVQLMFSFVTSNVFMLFAGALIKTLTGTEGGTPVPPAAPAGSVTSTQTVTSSPNPPTTTPVAQPASAQT